MPTLTVGMLCHSQRAGALHISIAGNVNQVGSSTDWGKVCLHFAASSTLLPTTFVGNRTVVAHKIRPSRDASCIIWPNYQAELLKAVSPTPFLENGVSLTPRQCQFDVSLSPCWLAIRGTTGFPGTGVEIVERVQKIGCKNMGPNDESR